MRFWKKREKDGESAMWKYAKYAVVAVCVIGIGANSISVIPTGYTGVKSTFGKISEKELTTGIHISVPFVQHIQTISNKQQDRRCEGKIWGETSDKTPVYGENVTVTYSISPEKSAWLCANVTDTDNLIKGSMVASAMKAAMAELAPEDVTNRGKIEPLTQKKLEEGGFIVVNPALLPAEGFTWAAYMRMSGAMLAECAEVCFLPDWKESKGAKYEFGEAMAQNKPFFFFADWEREGSQNAEK